MLLRDRIQPVLEASNAVLLVLLVLVDLLLSTRLLGQTGSGVVAGTVQDSGGSALIGARVVVQPTGREVATATRVSSGSQTCLLVSTR